MAIITKTFVAAFTSGGLPATGLSPLPDVTIREVGTGTAVVTAAASTEVGDGWYKYDLATYDTTKSYVATWSGGTALLVSERAFFGASESEPAELLTQTVLDKVAPGNVAEFLALTLGLNQQNFRLDATTYNGSGLLTAATIRLWDTKANAQAAGATGLLATYTVSVTPNLSEPTEVDDYTVVREP